VNVLSLFDGMSCGQLALQRAGFEVDIYMACEIDKYTMQITRKNFPNTIQMGDVCALRGENLPPIDILMGGSPCQGFSFAGKQLNFKDPRSALFFQFVRLLRETKPKYFLLENVRMKQEYQDVISEHLGVKPIMINSALVSAQNRVRLYWTNIPGIEQPEDKGLLLKDILQDLPFEEPPQYLLNKFGKKTRGELVKTPNEKSRCLNATMYKGQISTFVKRPCDLKEFNKDSTCHHTATATDIKGNESIKRVYADSGKSPTLTTMGGGHREPKVLVCRATVQKNSEHNQAGKSTTLTAAMGIGGGNVPMLMDKEGYLKHKGKYLAKERHTYRKLTPMECERLQTVPDGYTEGVSNTQRYKMLGNGWTVDVICHVLKNIRAEFARMVA
jgi:DNA (cytosine-5)-methyltransferase 3A